MLIQRLGPFTLIQPQLHYVTVDGVRLAYFEWGTPQPHRPTLFFVHATGFHGRIWDRVIEPFIPDFHVVSLEQRGHGRSDAVAVAHWDTFGKDMVAVLQALELIRVVGIAHSMGAHAMADAAGQTDVFEQLLLLDPTIAEPQAYESGADYRAAFGAGLHPAARRRNDFANAEEMIERLLPKSAFQLYDPRVLRDYCVHGLQQQPDGRYTLRCKPAVEAQVYMSARSNGAVYAQIARVDVPVTIIRAKQPAPDRQLNDFSSSPTWPQLASCFSRGQDLHWAQCTHFIPMQMPDRVIAQLKSLLQR